MAIPTSRQEEAGLAPGNPTLQSYGSLQAAYDHFNERLFGGQLPSCLLTLQRHHRAYGYYCAERFQSLGEGHVTDEIALNPEHFAERSLEAVLSTIVHEMVHLWQNHFGRRPRRCYHDRQWAAKMEEVGLMPTATGRPGGKRTGQRVTHLVVSGGPFQLACQALLERPVLYQDRLWMWVLEGLRRAEDPNSNSRELAGEREGNEASAWPLPGPVRPSSKLRFRCPRCGQNAWAKPTAQLACAPCGELMRAGGSPRAGGARESLGLCRVPYKGPDELPRPRSRVWRTRGGNHA